MGKNIWSVFLLLFFAFRLGAQTHKEIEKEVQKIQQIKNDSIRLDSLFYFAVDLVEDHPREVIDVGRQMLRDDKIGAHKGSLANADYLLALSFEVLADNPKSLQYYLEALRIQKELKIYSKQINICLGISRVYDQVKDFEKQKQYVEAALTICQQDIKDNKVKKKEPQILDYLATAYKNNGRLDTAIQLYHTAFEMAKDFGNKGQELNSLANLATALKSAKKYEASLQAYNTTISLIDTVNFVAGYMAVISNMSILFYDMGDLQKSEKYALHTIELAKKSNVPTALLDAYETLKNVYTQEKKYPEALQYFTKWDALKDTMLNQEKSAQIKELQTRYDTEAKDKQISNQALQLSYDRKINFFLGLVSLLLLAIGILAFMSQRRTDKLNKEITIKNKEVEKLNEVKDWIFSMIGHDLRTPVNSLLAFTQLIEAGNVPPEKMAAYAVALKNSLGYTSNLMENLLNWARTQMQGYKAVSERFDMADIAKQVVDLLQQEANRKNVILLNNIEADSIVLADANMTALLIRNLVSNAIKYSGSGGIVTLGVQKKDHILEIAVNDNGAGMPANIAEQINNKNNMNPLVSTPGTSHEKGTGLGLMLCKTFTGLMNGRLYVQSVVGKGSCFIVELLKG